MNMYNEAGITLTETETQIGNVYSFSHFCGFVAYKHSRTELKSYFELLLI